MWLVMISPLKIHIQTQNFGTEIVVVVVVKQGISMAWSWLQICFIIENVTLRIHSGVVTLQVYFTSISVGTKAGVQVSKREFHTRIHLDYVRVKFLSCIQKKKKNYTPFSHIHGGSHRKCESKEHQYNYYSKCSYIWRNLGSSI